MAIERDLLKLFPLFRVNFRGDVHRHRLLPAVQPPPDAARQSHKNGIDGVCGGRGGDQQYCHVSTLCCLSQRQLLQPQLFDRDAHLQLQRQWQWRPQCPDVAHLLVNYSRHFRAEPPRNTRRPTVRHRHPRRKHVSKFADTAYPVHPTPPHPLDDCRASQPSPLSALPPPDAPSPPPPHESPSRAFGDAPSRHTHHVVGDRGPVPGRCV